jgi:hypothetical protein
MKQYCTSTSTIDNEKYKDWEINQFIDYVYKAKNEQDAVANIKLILEQYKKRLSAWELIKLLLNK